MVPSSSSPAGSSEDTLIARARAGDRRAFESLVRANADRVYTVLARLCAGDVSAREATQATFVRAWRDVGCCPGDRSFFGWLCRVAIEEAARAGHLSAGGHRAAAAAPAGTTGDAFCDALERAVGRLRSRDRAPIVLCDVAGLPAEEAAQALGVRAGTLRRRLRRGRAALRRGVAADALDDERRVGSAPAA